MLFDNAKFYIQEFCEGEWMDYAQKDSAEIVMERINELVVEKPNRTFRGIVRVTTDHTIPISNYDRLNQTKES